jgi:catecholate siderophore receptor
MTLICDTERSAKQFRELSSVALRTRQSAFEPTLGLTGIGLLASLPGAWAQTPPDSAAPVALPAEDEASVALPVLDVSGSAPRYGQGGGPLPHMPVPIQDTPQSISVVPRALIEERGSVNLREALRNVPGISLAAGEGGFTGDNFTLRGFSARNDIYLQGIRDSAQYNRDPFFLDSIEVLKGPSSVMFGRGSTGGVVNLTPRLPQARDFGEFTLTGMSPAGIRATGDVNMVSGNVGVRMNAMGTTQNIAGRDHVTNERWGIFPSVTWGLGQDTQATISYLHMNEDNVPDFGVPFLNGRPVPVPRNTFYGLAGIDRERTSTDIITGSVQHRFANGITLSNTLRYGTYHRDIDATAPRLVTPVPSSLAAIMVNRQAQVRTGTDTILENQTELRAQATTGFVRHNIVAGAGIGRETSQLTRYGVNARPNATLFNPNFFAADEIGYVERRSVTSDAFTDAFTANTFFVDQMELGEYFELLLGGRYDHFGADFNNHTANLKLNRTDDMFSWRGAIVFKPVPGVRTYFSAGTSVNPSAETLTLAANTANLAPEKNRSFEVGASWDINPNISVRGAVFRIEKTNARTPDPTNGTLNVLSGHQHVDGFEISAAGRITDEWNVIAGYTYLDSNIDSSGTPAEVGRQLLNTPRNTATVWTTYDLPYGFQIGGGVTYLDDRFGNNTNTVKVPGYMRYDLTAAWSMNEQFTLRFNALNLTDKKFYDGVYQGNTTPGAGRTFLVSLTARY